MIRYLNNLRLISFFSIICIAFFIVALIVFLIINKKRKQTILIGTGTIIIYMVSILLLHVFNYKISKNTFIPINYSSFNWQNSQSINNTDLIEALDDANKLKRLYSIVIIKDGQLFAERYYHGASSNCAFSIKSVTKTIISLLVGIAINENLIDSLDQNIIDFFPEYRDKVNDKRKLDITVKDLLTMKAGFAEDCYDNFNYLFTQIPLAFNPNEKFQYSNISSNLLSEIITRVSDMSTKEFADKKLFTPLGIQSAKWIKMSNGTEAGQAGIYLTTRDMARIGYLILQKGKIDQEQIISLDWITLMTTDHNNRNDDDWIYHSCYKETGYGLHCWISEINGIIVYTARGHGGQMIQIFPKQDLVFAATQKANFTWPSQHLDRIDIFCNLIEIVLKKD